MPIDVYDRNEKHIGIIHKTLPENSDIYMVAITEKTVKDIDINFEWIMKSVAGIYECKNLLGKINEEKLKQKIEILLQKDEYQKFKGVKYNDLIKILFLYNLHGNVEKYLNISIDQDSIKGYILYDITNSKIKNGKLIIDKDINYIEDKVINNSTPIYAKVIDYPVIETDIMGVGELFLVANLADYGGRNHIHMTKLKINSGNYEDEIKFPFIINARKDTNIQLYIENNHFGKVFCNGVIYRLI